MREFIPCDVCKDKEGPEPGYYYSERDGLPIVRECVCHQKWLQETSLELKYSKADVLVNSYPYDRYVGTQSLNDLKLLKAFGENYSKVPKGFSLYVSGPNGTQKTSMCKNMGKEVIKQGYSVKYLSMHDLMNIIMPMFGADDASLTQKATAELLSYDLLIIDNCFDKDKMALYTTGRQIPYLDAFLRTRTDTYGNCTVYISSKEPDQIAKCGFSQSLQDFIVRKTQNSHLIFKDVYKDNQYQNFDRTALMTALFPDEEDN